MALIRLCLKHKKVFGG